MNETELFNIAVNQWRDKKGKGTMICPKPLDCSIPLVTVLSNVLTRSPTANILILVDGFTDRLEVVNKFKELNDKGETLLLSKFNDKHISIYSQDYNDGYERQTNVFLTICYKTNIISESTYVTLSLSRFKLVIVNKVLDNKSMTYLSKVCPTLDTFRQQELDAVRINTPVEEVLIPLRLDSNSEDAKLLDKYNKEISTSINIFGSFDVMNEARIGNSKTNTSALDVCNRIAKDNGWDLNLDMSIELNREIDKYYNPLAINDRASKTFELIRLRSNLLSDNNIKLKEISDIVKENKDKKILIINKRGEFASDVTNYLNTLNDKDICGNYHDKVENVIAIDDNGNIIYYKSGTKKGLPKYLGVTSQKKQSQRNFNLNKINVLSTSNSPDKELDIDVDIVIITSPLCEDIRSYLYRMSNLNVSNPLKLYTLYIKGTMEEKRIEEREYDRYRTVSTKEIDVDIENNDDCVVVD